MLVSLPPGIHMMVLGIHTYVIIMSGVVKLIAYFTVEDVLIVVKSIYNDQV